MTQQQVELLKIEKGMPQPLKKVQSFNVVITSLVDMASIYESLIKPAFAVKGSDIATIDVDAVVSISNGKTKYESQQHLHLYMENGVNNIYQAIKNSIELLPDQKVENIRFIY